MKIQIILSSLVILTFLSCSHQTLTAEKQLQERILSGEKDGGPLFLPGATTPKKENRAGNNASHKAGLMPLPPALDQMSYGQLTSARDFDDISTISEGFIKGAVVKFLIDNRTTPAHVYFVNGNYTENGTRPEFVQFHYYFAQKQLGLNLGLEDFNNQTYFSNDLKQKHFIAGTLQKYNVLQNGENTSFLGIQFYPQDAISDQSMLYAAQIVKSGLNFNDFPVKVVSSGSQQNVTSIAQALKESGMEATSVDRIYAGVSFIPMQPGKAFGYLRLNPKGAALDELMATDIPVFDELPLDLSVVSGVITTIVQDAGSHVNLKSKERHTPNMVLRDPVKIKDLEKYNNQPVQLIVDTETYQILPSTAKIVKAEFDKKNKNKKWTKIVSGTDKELISFDLMAAKNLPYKLVQSAKSYGGKASKLALLANNKIAGMGSAIQKQIGYRLTPMGFAVPVTAYQDFVNSNPVLKQKIQFLVESEMGQKGNVPPSPQKRIELLKEIQNLFYETNVPANLAQNMAQQVNDLKTFAAATYPLSKVKKVKIRSSANAEDIPNFDGAGLHSSFSAKIDEMGSPEEKCRVVVSQDGVATKEEVEPETILCAVKGVFASLWNKRAIEERNFAKIDQSSAVMGLAVNASYDFRKKTEDIKEVANAVLVTRIINTKGVYGYRLSVNTDENLVTNPTPGTQAEIVYASFIGMAEAPQFTFIQFAKTDAHLEAMNKQLLPAAVYNKMIDIARHVETSYCQNISKYYPGQDCEYVTYDIDKPSSLDMEFKIYSNGEVLLKQAREFSGR